MLLTSTKRKSGAPDVELDLLSAKDALEKALSEKEKALLENTNIRNSLKKMKTLIQDQASKNAGHGANSSDEDDDDASGEEEEEVQGNYAYVLRFNIKNEETGKVSINKDVKRDKLDFGKRDNNPYTDADFPVRFIFHPVHGLKESLYPH